MPIGSCKFIGFKLSYKTQIKEKTTGLTTERGAADGI